MRLIEGENFAEVYTEVMRQLLKDPEYVASPRGKKINEITNCALTIRNPYSSLFKCIADKSLTMPTGYTKKEMLLYLSGTNSVEKFAKASPFWNTIKNPDGKTINSAYGNLIFRPSLADGRSQFDWAYESLLADRDSRQAFIRFNNTSHQYMGVKDLPCTFVGVFHIRNNSLNFTIEMRSNDIVKGLVHDEPSFVLFQHLMLLKLKANPGFEDLEIGTYTHIANSLHLYEDDFEMTSRRYEAGIIPNSHPMPNDFRIIGSADVAALLENKLDKTGIFPDIVLSDNIDFYKWTMS